MKKIHRAIAAAAVAGVTAGVIPVTLMSAGAADSTDPYSNCQLPGYNRQACVVIINETEGFTAPGKVSSQAGVNFADGSYQRESGWVVRGPGGEKAKITTIAAGAGFHKGIDPVVLSTSKYSDTATGAWGTFNFVPQGALQFYGPLRFLIGVGYSASDNFNCDGTSPYINCGMSENSGGNNARLRLTVTNQPIVIKIINHLEAPLIVQTTGAPTNIAPSNRGSSPDPTVNGAVDKAPGITFWGGYAMPARTANGSTSPAKEHRWTLSYSVGNVPSTSSATNEFKGAELQMNIVRDGTGKNMSSCYVNNPSGATTLNCKVSTIEQQTTGVLQYTINVG